MYRPYYVADHFYQVGGRVQPSSHGGGIGSILSTVWRFIKPLFGNVSKSIIPAVKSVGQVAKQSASKVLKSDTAKSIAKDLKDTAIKTGLDLATTTLAGEESSQSAKDKVRKGLKDVRKRSATKLGALGELFNTPDTLSITSPKKKSRKKIGVKKASKRKIEGGKEDSSKLETLADSLEQS
jgi:hypothetical protein